ncbi:MAG TPA: hypothetical protein VFS05_03065 [Gemmatimonadaceae bacterium]|nr:hypothetical protein [Gemmatimonadaceae bacterium]
MSKKHDDERGKQKGAQAHAEGQHGEKAHKHLIEQLQSGPGGGGRERENAAGDPTHAEPGKHRMFEERQQHDEADKNQEKNRLVRDIERHGHDREEFRVPGGTTAHPQDASHSGSGHTGGSGGSHG